MAVASMIRMPRVIHTLQILALCLPALACSRQAPPERVVTVDLLDNGDFAEQSPEGVPWWRTSRAAAQIASDGGKPCLATRAGDFAEQPIAAYAPLAEQLVLEGEVHGDGLLTLVDGAGTSTPSELKGAGWRPFRIQAPKGA